MTPSAPCLLTCKDIEKKFRIPRSTLYQRIKEKQFPPPIKMGRGSYWDETEIAELIEERKRDRDW